MHGHKHISHQRGIALFLTGFAAVRTIFWLGMIAALLLGVPLIHHLSESLPFVALISFYANGFTDFGTFTSGLAAVYSADSHGDAEATRRIVSEGDEKLNKDIMRLASMPPGAQAVQLAVSIKSRVNGV